MTQQSAREQGSSPFFQQKPELDGDERWHEIEAEDRRPELQAGGRYELQAEEIRRELPAQAGYSVEEYVSYQQEL